jgi:ferredoxin-thioredoxin reductase catalytic subunit/rubredoxin
MERENPEPSPEEINRLYSHLEKEAKQGGYNLNPDVEFVRGLVKGLLVNERRYGYQACPCRLAADDKIADLDIICPCYYRDADVTEFGACYCALYVSKAVCKGEQKLGSIPERRPPKEMRQKLQPQLETQSPSDSLPSASVAEPGARSGTMKLSVPVWRCLVCGYLCGRDAPPEICPICKAGKERFERFI